MKNAFTRLMDWLIGDDPNRCEECGAAVLDGEGFRWSKGRVFCDEEHALDFQLFLP